MSFFSKYLSRETSSVRLSLNPNFTLVFGLIFSLVLSNLILNGMVIGVSAQSIPQPNNQSANQTPNQPQPLSPTNQTSTNNPNSSPTQPQSSPSTDPYSEQVTKTVRNGADGSGSTTLKIGTEIRDDSPLAVREYARLNPNDAGIQSAFNSGTLVCTQMGGRIGGDNSPAKLEVEDGKGGIKEVDVPIAHPSRRIGICQDGFYSLSNRMIDTAGNVGEWTESKVIERDTVSPLVPVVEVSKSGDIWAEYLSLNLSKAEAGSTATIEVFLNPDKDSSDVGTIVKTFTAVIPEDANYTNTNLIGKLLCGGGKYSIRVKLTDRALNGSEYSEFQSITTKDCPRCGYSGGEFAIPIRNDLQNRPVQWVVTQDFDSHGGSIDLATLGVENFGHGIPVYPIAPGKVVVAKYQGGIPQIYGKDNHVLIDHGNGLKAWYVHFMNETNQGLSSLPKVGDYVTTDTVIGHLGNTGLYYTSYTGQYAGTHLHLNVTLNGKDIDPSQNWGTSPNVDCYVDTLGDDPYNGEHAENLGSIELEFIKKGNRIEFTKSNIPAPKLTAVTTENNQDYTIYGVAIKKNHPTIAKIYEEKCILWAFNCKTELRETKNINIHHAEVKAYKETWTGHWGIHQQWNDDELGRFSFTKNIPKDLHDNEHIYARSYIYGEFDCLGLKCKYGDNVFNNLNESGKSNRVLPKQGLGKGKGIEKNFGVYAYDDSRIASFKLFSSPDNQKYISKYDQQEAPEVWIVSHGMLDNGLSDPMKAISEGIKQDRQKNNKKAVILNLDWRGAADASWYRDPQQTDEWIRPTAEEAFKRLKEWGVTDPNKINFVGHSMGTMIVNEVARQYNLEYNQSVAKMYYLDPPSYWTPNRIIPPLSQFRVDDRYGNDNKIGNSRDAIYKEGHGYTKHATANIQRSFTGTNRVGADGLCGNTKLAMTAKEYLDFGFTDIMDDTVNLCPAHESPNYAFSKMLQYGGFDTTNSLNLNQGNMTVQNHGFTYSADKHGYIFATEQKGNTTPQNLTIKQNDRLTQYGFKDRGNQFSNFNFGTKLVNKYSDKILVTIANFNDDEDRISLQKEGLEEIGSDNRLHTFTYSISGNTIKRKSTCSVGLLSCPSIDEFEELVVEGVRKEGFMNNPTALDPSQNYIIFR